MTGTNPQPIRYPAINPMGIPIHANSNACLRISFLICFPVVPIVFNKPVNWSYIAANFSMDFNTIVGIGAALLLIILTGYLIIYNIFQISVVRDIRFYGLLKTIGTTGKQIKKVIRRQALITPVNS